jgi:hypothetical protein
VWVGNAQRSCLQPKDYAFMKAQLARGNTVEGTNDYTYPFSPRDLAHYGLKPQYTDFPDCGHLDGVVSGYSGAAPIWHAYMSAALKGVPDTWYTEPPNVIVRSTGQGFDDSDFYLPGTQPGPGGSTNCTYYGPTPLPTQICTYAGPSAAPPPPPPSPSPSPGATPTPSPSPSPTP